MNEPMPDPIPEQEWSQLDIIIQEFPENAVIREMTDGEPDDSDPDE